MFKTKTIILASAAAIFGNLVSFALGAYNRDFTIKNKKKICEFKSIFFLKQTIFL